MITMNHPTAAQPIDLDKLEALATAATPGPWEATRQTDDECNFIGYYIEAGNKTISDDGTAPDSNDAQFIAAANPTTLLALIALARQQPAASEQSSAAPSGKDAADEPAARVDRIISASGLAEVSVFLESALKVGTVFYAAAPTCPACQGNDKNMPCAYPSKGMLGCLRDERLSAAAKSEQAPCPFCGGKGQVRVAHIPGGWAKCGECSGRASAAGAGSEQFDWMKAERIRDEGHVDEALRNFREDPTGDNATGVIQAALTVWTADVRALAKQSAAPAAPHAQAEPVNLTAARAAFDDRHCGYEFPSSALRSGALDEFIAGWKASRAPVPQEAEQAGDIELIRIPAHDADSYCRILSIIGMEEEGDPVAEVQRLFDAAQEAEQAATTCQWPLCQPEQVQQEVADQVHRELYSGEQAATAAVTDERAAFKAHFIAEGWGEHHFERYNVYDPDDTRNYHSRHITDMWDGWKARAALSQPAAPAVTDAARVVLADDRYLNDDCDAPMRNGACTECGFGPCRRTQSKE